MSLFVLYYQTRTRSVVYPQKAVYSVEHRLGASTTMQTWDSVNRSSSMDMLEMQTTLNRWNYVWTLATLHNAALEVLLISKMACLMFHYWNALHVFSKYTICCQRGCLCWLWLSVVRYRSKSVRRLGYRVDHKAGFFLALLSHLMLQKYQSMHDRFRPIEGDSSLIDMNKIYSLYFRGIDWPSSWSIFRWRRGCQRRRSVVVENNFKQSLFLIAEKETNYIYIKR